MTTIVYTTTFRDFDESQNSKIQELFLNSIKSQTYENYILVVTTFGEKKVKPVVEKYLGDKCIVIDEKLDGYRYSPSSVLLNGLEIAKQYEEAIVVWSTCDIILQENTFEKMSAVYSKSLVGTIHPNLIANTVEDYKSGVLTRQGFDRGIDILFFSKEWLTNKDVNRILHDYYFYEWGIFEHFLAGVSFLHSNDRKNLFCVAPVKKIENDREAAKEPSQWLKNCYNRNLQLLQAFEQKEGCTRHILDLCYCHMKFKMYKAPFSYYLLSLGEYWKVYSKRFRGLIKNIFKGRTK